MTEPSNSHEVRLKQQIQDLQQLNLELTQELEQVYASRSWKLTAPLRHLAHQRFLRQEYRRQHSSGGSLRYWLGRILQRLARIGWLRQLVLQALMPFPRLKHFLQRLLAQVPFRRSALLRQQDNADDFADMLPVVMADVRHRELQLRDTLLLRTTLQNSIQSVCLTGHFSGSYSLATVNRHLLTRLVEDLPDLQLSLQPWEGQLKRQVDTTPGGSTEVAWLNQRLVQSSTLPLSAGQHIQLFHHYPLIDQVDPTLGLPVALFFWEESRVPESMIDTLNRHYAGVVVTAWFVKKVLMDSGCCLPIQVVTLPLQEPSGAHDAQLEDLHRAAERQQVHFLHVSSCFPRKGVDVLLEAFNRVAGKHPQIHLTIKTFSNQHNAVEDLIETLILPGFRDRLHLIMDDYSDDQMAQLYRAADVVVLPSRGEGLNLPGIEAGAFSRLLVVTGYGAHTDFAWHDNAWWIPYRFSPAQTHFSDSFSVWVDPSVQGLANLFIGLTQRLLSQDQSILDHASHLRNHVRQRIYSASASDSFLTGLHRIKHYAEADFTRHESFSISLVTTWGEACGIAEYSRYLARELKHQGVEIELAIPQGRRTQVYPEDAGYTVSESWMHGQAPDLRWSELKGDIVWLQHHFAFYSLDRRLLAGVQHLRKQGKRVYITLHTSRPLLGFERGRIESAVACLNGFDRVFVHTLDDLNALKRVGVVDVVTLMQQGVEIPEAPLISVDDTTRIIGSFGFLLPHKGIEQLIEAFADASRQGVLPAGTRLRLVTAIRKDSTSPHEFERCQRLARELNVAEAIDWYTDFLPLEQVHELLSACQLIVLPYQYTQESSSAAVRTAVAACRHVATTPAPIFDEVRSVTLPIEGYDAADVCELFKHYFSDSSFMPLTDIMQERERWISLRSWSFVARQYHHLFQSALVDRDMQKLFDEQ